MDLKTRVSLASFTLRAGLSIVFLYAAISSLTQQATWLAFLPSFMRYSSILTLFSIYEILLSLWLLSSYRTYYAAIISALTMTAIISANLFALDIVFRDVAILSAAISLIVINKAE